MRAELTEGRVPVKLWAPVEEVEAQALAQVQRVAALPWAFHHVAIMADCHFGIGCTVGSVIAMKDAVAPAAVGVDIGCGMAALRTNLTAADMPDSLAALRSDVEAVIPVGNGPAGARANSDHVWGPLFAEFATLDEKVHDLRERAGLQMGTLGGGNHFIELCLDTDGRVWMMLHSGSRNIGKVLADIHIARARTLTHNATLPDPDLAVFLAGTPEMAAYRRDLFWAQRYADANRVSMLMDYSDVMRRHFPHFTVEDRVACHHNYVAEERHFGEDVLVTRKGAIRAGLGDMGIIPGSMGTRSYIVRGLGNPDSFESASHGAGRRMSRGAARRKFTLADLAEQTAGVECRKDIDVVDEIPGAYKAIDEVMANQRDLVEVVAELHAVMCVKG